MRVSSVNAGLPFKAKVESTNPLISGDWKFVQDPSENGIPQNGGQPAPKKESHWFRNTIITLAVLGLACYGLVKGKNTEAVQKVMQNGASTFTEKLLKGIGVAGDYIQRGYNAVVSRLPKFGSKA